jgi:ketosteroid isomerase-like protein
MPNIELPGAIADYFAARGGDAEATLALFTEDATINDIGEDKVLEGTAQIRDWLGGISDYKLTTEFKSFEQRDGKPVVKAVVSGDFPGSPYEFEYRFELRGDKISRLDIDPIGSLAV